MMRSKTPPDKVAFTCTHVVEGREPVLSVSHSTAVSDEDSGWTFHCGREDHDDPDIRVVALSVMECIDPSLAELRQMPLGHWAYRPDPAATWSVQAHDECLG